jgi:hypothetical protein
MQVRRARVAVDYSSPRTRKLLQVDHAHDDAGERPQQSRARALSDLARGKKEKAPQQKGTNTKKEYNDQSQDAETPAERRRREEALRGVEEEDEEEQQPKAERRGRTQGRDEEIETTAERRRREAALGVGEEEDSDDDDTPRVRPPVTKSRGIRFAESPVRGK